jgi:hypothetical protein
MTTTVRDDDPAHGSPPGRSLLQERRGRSLPNSYAMTSLTQRQDNSQHPYDIDMSTFHGIAIRHQAVVPCDTPRDLTPLARPARPRPESRFEHPFHNE